MLAIDSRIVRDSPIKPDICCTALRGTGGRGLWGALGSGRLEGPGRIGASPGRLGARILRITTISRARDESVAGGGGPRSREKVVVSAGGKTRQRSEGRWTRNFADVGLVLVSLLPRPPEFRSPCGGRAPTCRATNPALGERSPRGRSCWRTSGHGRASSSPGCGRCTRGRGPLPSCRTGHGPHQTTQTWCGSPPLSTSPFGDRVRGGRGSEVRGKWGGGATRAGFRGAAGGTLREGEVPAAAVGPGLRGCREAEGSRSAPRAALWDHLSD